MTTLLPLLALAIALAASLLAKPASKVPEHGRTAASIWVIVVSALLIMAAYVWKGWNTDATRLAVGMAIGAVACSVCRWIPSPARALAGLAIAGATGGFLLWIPEDWRMRAQLGAIAGAALAAWLIEVRSPSAVAIAIFPAALAATEAGDILGAKGMAGGDFGLSGTLLMTAAAAAGVLGVLATVRGLKFNLQKLVAVVILALAVLVIGGRYLALRDIWILTLAGVLVGVATNWLIDSGEDALRPLMAAVLWIGLATIGFALRRGYGMSLSLVGGVSTLVLLGNPRALLTLGPLAGLVMYRLFREFNVDATRALDIGQHYALVGFATGALLPLLPVEWLRSRTAITPRLPFAAVLWVVLLAALPIVLGILLGAKGAVGFVAGLGMAALIESVRTADSLQPLSLATGLAAGTTMAFQFLGDNSAMTRDEKMAILLPLGIGFVVLIVVLLVVSPKPRLEEAAAL